jgi:hypothetical protein
MAWDASSCLPRLIQGQRVLLGSGGARVQVDAWFQARCSLRRGCRQAHNERREGPDHGHTESAHGNER